MTNQPVKGVLWNQYHLLIHLSVLTVIIGTHTLPTRKRRDVTFVLEDKVPLAITLDVRKWMDNGRIGVLGVLAPEHVLEKMGGKVQDLEREIVFLPSMEETHVMKTDMWKLKNVQAKVAPSHIVL